MEPLRGDGVSGLTVAVVRVAVEIIPNDGDFGSWLMPNNRQIGEERGSINNRSGIMKNNKETQSSVMKTSVSDKNMAAEPELFSWTQTYSECGAGICDSWGRWELVG